MKKFHVIVPTVLAIMALAAGLRVSDPLSTSEYSVESAPTPYSTSHAVAQSRPGLPEGHAETF